MKILLLNLLLLIAALVVGCGDEQVVVSGDDDVIEMSTPMGVAKYLDGLPAVESVEIWDNEYGPGITIGTAHYDIHCTLLEPLMLRQIPAFMESAYREYQKQLPVPIGTRNKFTIYLFDDREQWEQFTREFTGDKAELYMKIKKGAYYLNGACVTYNIGRTRTFSVLGHEGWHQFNSRHFAYRLPSWLDEGIATMFETSTYSRNQFEFDAAKNLGRLGSLRQAIVEGRLIPLEQLISLNPGEVVHYADTDSVMSFYAQSYGLIRFLREEGFGKRLDQYHDLLLDGLEGKWPLTETQQRLASNRNIPLTVQWNRFVSPLLFKHYIAEDFAEIEKEYYAFCRKVVYNIRLKRPKK